MTSEEIEKMIADAQEWAEEDREIKERIDMKNSLENYLYTMRNTVEDKDRVWEKYLVQLSAKW